MFLPQPSPPPILPRCTTHLPARRPQQGHCDHENWLSQQVIPRLSDSHLLQETEIEGLKQGIL